VTRFGKLKESVAPLCMFVKFSWIEKKITIICTLSYIYIKFTYFFIYLFVGYLWKPDVKSDEIFKRIPNLAILEQSFFIF